MLGCAHLELCNGLAYSLNYPNTFVTKNYVIVNMMQVRSADLRLCKQARGDLGVAPLPITNTALNSSLRRLPR